MDSPNCTFLFQPDDIRPAGCGVGAAVVVADGVGKDIGFAGAVAAGVLLGA